MKGAGSADSEPNFSPHLNAVHVSTAPSLLSRRISPGFRLSSSEARNERRAKEGRNTSSPLDITGFKHLLMLVLVSGNIKMIWADWNQIGFWNTLENFGLGSATLKNTALVSLSNFLYMPLALLIERCAAWATVPAKSDVTRDRDAKEPHAGNQLILCVMNLLQLSLCITAIAGGSYFTWTYVQHPLAATACEANVIVTFLKLVSFTLTNRELRAAWSNKTPIPGFYTSAPQYPHNLTLNNMALFWVAPTLIYQPVYPLRPEVRWSRVISLLGEIITGTLVVWVLMMQMGMPVIEHLVENFNSWQIFAEDYVTLAMVNIMIWLTGFVVLFQSTLNLMAEITRFADRNFYGDWWNAGCVGTFWRDWNRPVSNFFRRHLYIPLRTLGCSRMIASNVVFLASACLHELLFGVATHNFNGVAFLCMVVQPVLILATAPLEKTRGRGTTVGNCVFWISILFGQPTAIVIYYLEWVAKNPYSKSITFWWSKTLSDYTS